MSNKHLLSFPFYLKPLSTTWVKVTIYKPSLICGSFVDLRRIMSFICELTENTLPLSTSILPPSFKINSLNFYFLVFLILVQKHSGDRSSVSSFILVESPPLIVNFSRSCPRFLSLLGFFTSRVSYAFTIHFRLFPETFIFNVPVVPGVPFVKILSPPPSLLV